jgi:hypothetical protein
MDSETNCSRLGLTLSELISRRQRAARDYAQSKLSSRSAAMAARRDHGTVADLLSWGRPTPSCISTCKPSDCSCATCDHNEAPKESGDNLSNNVPPPLRLVPPDVPIKDSATSPILVRDISNQVKCQPRVGSPPLTTSPVPDQPVADLPRTHAAASGAQLAASPLQSGAISPSVALTNQHSKAPPQPHVAAVDPPLTARVQRDDGPAAPKRPSSAPSRGRNRDSDEAGPDEAYIDAWFELKGKDFSAEIAKYNRSLLLQPTPLLSGAVSFGKDKVMRKRFRNFLKRGAGGGAAHVVKAPLRVEWGVQGGFQGRDGREIAEVLPQRDSKGSGGTYGASRELTDRKDAAAMRQGNSKSLGDSLVGPPMSGPNGVEADSLVPRTSFSRRQWKGVQGVQEVGVFRPPSVTSPETTFEGEGCRVRAEVDRHFDLLTRIGLSISAARIYTVGTMNHL